MSKIEIHCERDNSKSWIVVDGVKLHKVCKICLEILPRQKALLSVDCIACDANGKPVVFFGEFVTVTQHYEIDLGDLELSGIKLVPKEDAQTE